LATGWGAWPAGMRRNACGPARFHQAAWLEAVRRTKNSSAIVVARFRAAYVEGVIEDLPALPVRPGDQDVRLIYRTMGLEATENVGPRLADAVEDLLDNPSQSDR
jgi:hypothetical protein